MEVLRKMCSVPKNLLDNFVKDKYFLFLSLLFFVFLILNWGKFGDPVIDCGREAYIPYAMADLGRVLFKDIICIYGPVPYYINALIIKLFGANLNVMYFIGALLSYVFLFGIYNIAKRFIGAILAFIFSNIIVFCCILNSSISNYIFPYSYAIIYALVFAAYHLIFMFKFINSAANIDFTNHKYLYISAFLLSLCLLSKLDFLPCIIPFLIMIFIYRKKLDLKVYLLIMLSFLMPFLLVGIVLLIQKVSLQNLIFNFKMISNMAHSPSLEYFYSVCTGYFFEFKKTFMFTKEFLISSAILLLSGFLGSLAFNVKNKFFCICACIAICFMSLRTIFALNLLRYVFLYIPLCVSIFFILKCLIFIVKKIKNPLFKLSDSDIAKYLFILFSILFCLKSLFGLFHELYGTYYIPFILLSFIIIFNISQNSKTRIVNIIKMIGIILILIFWLQNFLIFNVTKTGPVKTSRGIIYTEKPLAHSLNSTIQFLDDNLKTNETVLVLPEGLLINFMLQKYSPYFNTSFTPLDFDAYGEKYLIEKFIDNQPKYLVFLLRSYKDYNKTFICTDFGIEFCNTIFKKYTLKTQFGSANNAKLEKGYLTQIFERKSDD